MNSDLSTGFVGKGAKGTSEFNIFQKWDLSDIPLGSVIDGANWKFRTSANSAGSGSMHFGLLFKGVTPGDSIWNTSSGFNQGSTPGLEYTKAFAFPDNVPRDAPPHATQDGSTTVETGRIFLGLFSGGPFSWTPSNPAAEADVTFGDGIGSETYNFAATSAINAWRNQLNGNTDLGVTWDSNNVATSTQFIVYMDKIDNGKEPTLTIVYTENPPDITSTAITAATVLQPYTYDVDATPYILGDQTNGTALDLVFTLDAASLARGMTIVASTGVIDWTPTLRQFGSFPVTVTVTNAGGLTDIQAYTIVVPLVGFPGKATIANGALVLLGEKLITNLDSQARSAKVIKDRFDDVRDDLLRTLPWNFATRRAMLAASAVPPVNVWARAFRLPDDFIRLLEVEDRDGWRYQVEGQSIVTDLPAPLNITYVARITEVDEMDALFRYTLSASLAVEIAEVVTGDSQILQYAFDVFQSRLATAWTVNGQERPTSTFAKSDWERIRGREN